MSQSHLLHAASVWASIISSGCNNSLPSSADAAAGVAEGSAAAAIVFN